MRNENFSSNNKKNIQFPRLLSCLKAPSLLLFAVIYVSISWHTPISKTYTIKFWKFDSQTGLQKGKWIFGKSCWGWDDLIRECTWIFERLDAVDRFDWKRNVRSFNDTPNKSGTHGQSVHQIASNLGSGSPGAWSLTSSSQASCCNVPGALNSRTCLGLSVSLCAAKSYS